MSEAAVAVPAIPFKGLAPFDDSELDALLFFGREREIEVIVANLMAARLTVLYGPSGVGKTSLLRAGVTYRLRREREALVAVVSSWTGDPVQELLDAVEEAARDRSAGAVEPVRRSGSLADVLAAWTRRLGADVYLILDQFEEYFVYHEGETGPGTLAEELPEAVRAAGLRVNFLIGIREDALARLDAFKSRIPNLFANSLRLDLLDRRAAEAAIRGPIGRYNELVPQERRVEVEPELVEAVLHEVAVGRVDLGFTGRGGAEDTDGGRIEAPYLQLVLERLWEVEARGGSRRLRLETLRELGGAARIVEDHLTRAMADLTPEEKDAAAAMYNHLVTPSGTKIAHRTRDLAGYAAVDETEAARVLDRLVRERIVRAGEDGAAGPRYEIFHDVLAEAVLAWRAKHETDRRLEAERREAERRHRRMLVVAVAALIAVAVLAAIAAYALAERGRARTQARQAHARELAAKATADLSIDPDESLRLALAAARLERSAAIEDLLRSTLRALHVRAVLPAGGGPVAEVSFAPNGKYVIVAGGGGDARIFRTADGRLVRSLHHGAPLAAASFAPDSVTVVTAGRDGVARIWNARNGAPLRVLHHRGPVTSATFSRDGRLLATTSEDGSARIWDVASGRLVQRLRHPHAVATASFSSDGRYVVTTLMPRAFDRVARVFDVATGRLVARLVQRRRLTHAGFAPSGYQVATASTESVARIWDGQTGALLRELYGHHGPVRDAEFNPAGDRLVTASTDQTARVWNTHTGATVSILTSHSNYLLRAVFSPDGKRVATASVDRTARIFDAESGTLRAVLVGHRDSVTSIVFRHDGTMIATGSHDGTVRLWDPRPQPELMLLGRQGSAIASVAFSRNGRYLTSVDLDGRLSVWSGAHPIVLRALRRSAGRGRSVLSADARRVATAIRNGVRVADTRTGRVLLTLRRGSGVEPLAFSADDGELITTGSHRTAAVWRLSDGKLLYTLAGHRRRVVAAAFSPDSRRVVTASADATARIWNGATGRLEHVLVGHTGRLTSASFSPDGRLVVTASFDHDARVWNSSSGKLVWLLRGHNAVVSGVAFSADGRWIVTAGPRSAGLWEVRNGRPLMFVTAARPILTAAAFSPHGWRIATGGSDGSVRTYDCRLCGGIDQLIALGRARLVRLHVHR